MKSEKDGGAGKASFPGPAVSLRAGPRLTLCGPACFLRPARLSRVQLGVALVQKALVADDGAGVGPLADGAFLIAGFHGEIHHLAVGGHAGDGGRGGDGHADGRGRVVAHVQMGADAALTLVQKLLEALERGVFHHAQHKGRSKHRQRAGADGGGGQLIGDSLMYGEGRADLYSTHDDSSFLRGRTRWIFARLRGAAGRAVAAALELL